MAKIDLKKISKSINTEIDKVKTECCTTVTVCHSSTWTCEYCGSNILVMCLQKQAKYCPVCGFRILNGVN